jgi:hypothetical protein
LFSFFESSLSKHGRLIDDQLNSLNKCIKTDKDISLVFIALSAISHHRKLPKKIPAEFNASIQALKRIYEKPGLGYLTNVNKEKFDELFKRKIQERMNQLKELSSEEKIALMKESMGLEQNVCSELEKKPLKDQKNILRAFYAIRMPKTDKYIRGYTIRTLTEAAISLEGTTSTLEDVIELAKAMMTHETELYARIGLIKVLAEAVKSLEGTAVTVDYVLELAMPMLTPEMDGYERGYIILTLTEVAIG